MHWIAIQQICATAIFARLGNRRFTQPRKESLCGQCSTQCGLLGHASVLTTKRYLGASRILEEHVTDRFECLFASRFVDLRFALIWSDRVNSATSVVCGFLLLFLEDRASGSRGRLSDD
jgi:hypothetical protein